MKTKIFSAIIILAVVAAAIYGYRRMSGERNEEAEKPIAAASHVQHGPGGQAIVNLDEATQNLIGLQTAPLAAERLPPEIQAFGRVLDPAPLVSLAGEISAARAALEASSKEYERVKTLFSQGENASARTVQMAQAATMRDQVALDTAEAQLAAAWGQAFTDQPGRSALFQSLIARQSALLRLDLPSGASLHAMPLSARLLLPGTGQSLSARFLSPAATIDPQVQGEGFIFVYTNPPPNLAPGLAIMGFLQLPGQPTQGVMVPDAAVVRTDERAWVYVQSGATNFLRKEITLNRQVANGWFVTGGVAPDERVVVTGAQTLLSEERKNEVKVGD
jgi:hypothetical protein